MVFRDDNADVLSFAGGAVAKRSRSVYSWGLLLRVGFSCRLGIEREFSNPSVASGAETGDGRHGLEGSIRIIWEIGAVFVGPVDLLSDMVDRFQVNVAGAVAIVAEHYGCHYEGVSSGASVSGVGLAELLVECYLMRFGVGIAGYDNSANRDADDGRWSGVDHLDNHFVDDLMGFGVLFDEDLSRCFGNASRHCGDYLQFVVIVCKGSGGSDFDPIQQSKKPAACATSFFGCY